MTKKSEQRAAFYDNLRTLGAMGGDLGALRGLGYAVDDVDFEQQVRSGREVLAAARRIQRELGGRSITCADCFTEVAASTGCSHIRMDPHGKIHQVASY